MATKQKITVYVRGSIFEELAAEAARQDRSMSWVIERAWLAARKDLREKFPSITELPGGDADALDQDLAIKAS